VYFVVFQEYELLATKTSSMYRRAVPLGLVQVNVTTPETTLPAAGLVILTGVGVGVACAVIATAHWMSTTNIPTSRTFPTNRIF
jgi:hypothetical protein